jgi:hypothetical protein
VRFTPGRCSPPSSVAQITTPQTGTIWFYKRLTLGYRMLHLYLPRQDAVIAFGLNSQPDPKQDES